MRLLQAARLSRLQDDSTGIATQDASARQYADAGGHVIIATAEDTDVAGDTDPWSRPALGPWLTDPALISQYDGIVAAHVDRLARSTIHFMRLLHWADENGKTIITTGTQGIDFSQPIGKLLGYIISWLGEQELTSIKRRAAASRKWLIDNGYLSGRAPWGFLIVDKDQHKTLEPDPELVPVIRDIIDRYLAGEKMTALARWLNTEGIRTPYGNEWSSTPLREVFRSQSLCGRRKNAAGGTDLRFPGIISAGQWARLQKVMDARAVNKLIAPETTAMLTNVVQCAKCGGVMYQLLQRKPTTSYRYYRCTGTEGKPSKCRNMIRVETLDDWLDDWFVNVWGDYEMFDRVITPGTGYDAEIDDNRAELASLDPDANDYLDRATALYAERKRLRALTAEPDTVDVRPTGVTLGQLWPTLTTAERRKRLLDAGIKVRAVKGSYTLVGDPHKLIAAITGVEFSVRSLIGVELPDDLSSL